tara:strand:+ start:291 stop:488 length:198 start_codon:yes stop_codon:yes gene_type:complete
MIKKQTAFPDIPEELLGELDSRFPEKCAELSWDEKEVWFAAGQRSVVRFLLQIHKEQREIKIRSS